MGSIRSVPELVRAFEALEERVAALEAKVGGEDVGERVRHLKQEITVFRVLAGKKLDLHPAVRKALEPPKIPKVLLDELWARGLIER